MLRASLARAPQGVGRRMTTAAAQQATKKEGDISDAFVSLSGVDRPPLPDRFRQLKCDLVRGREAEIKHSWTRLLGELRRENDVIAAKGPAVIPQVEYKDLEAGIDGLQAEIRKRGAVVVRGVVPAGEARAYKEEAEEYIAKNPATRAFPQHDPQVYELYWSAPQLKARSHPALLDVQRQLMARLWHTSSATARISLDHPLTYADRLRIRQPGDAAFALGPHMDGGSVERWEPAGYGRGAVYDAVFAGRWEDYDAWDAGGRVSAVNNLYEGLGPCTMFRAWQGWLSMSATRPREGTLLVKPLVQLSTAYVLLRPFFEAGAAAVGSPGYLDAANWRFTGVDAMTSELQGATPGTGQELNDELHPHLELERSMVHVPEIGPGDYVAWHCDTIHSVDRVHVGTGDSSVLYIPVCPTTELNAAYAARQRSAFRAGTPGPDFPGGDGEARHVDRPSEEMLRRWGGDAGARAMGLEPQDVNAGMMAGPREAVERANAVLGF
ncbi:hypothetical protein AK830_g5467 [Neonectria ditissima]|uniref:DUF1479 domain protein n=1 Tax=Neonectria ditissima TaxID=78410 RepID=A0A0P7BL36_9HYPO|nr:hypothetical protein AK830_g5467 [Neonectria ditissima]